jgi:hypothetical protein
MEIKVAPVPSELRFTAPNPSSEVAIDKPGVPWQYVVLLCGGCILITVVVFQMQEKSKQKNNEFVAFQSKIK